MRFSILAITAAAATGAIAAPVLPLVTALEGVLEKVPLVGEITAPLAKVLNNLGGAHNATNILYTIAKDPAGPASGVKTLSILNGAGTDLLAQICADKIVSDIDSSIPIDFSQVTADGLGKFLLNDIPHDVENVLQTAPAVQCLTHITDEVTVFRCVVPKVESVALRLVEDVTGAVNCLAGKIQPVGELVTDVESKVASIPIFSGLALLGKIPGVPELVYLLGL